MSNHEFFQQQLYQTSKYIKETLPDFEIFFTVCVVAQLYYTGPVILSLCHTASVLRSFHPTKFQNVLDFDHSVKMSRRNDVRDVAMDT